MRSDDRATSRSQATLCSWCTKRSPERPDSACKPYRSGSENDTALNAWHTCMQSSIAQMRENTGQRLAGFSRQQRRAGRQAGCVLLARTHVLPCESRHKNSCCGRNRAKALVCNVAANLAPRVDRSHMRWLQRHFDPAAHATALHAMLATACAADSIAL